jgi:hypothetical protein
MISDSVPDKICKKCGGTVVYWDEDAVKQFGPVKVLHDFTWSSNVPCPEDIDPNYVPK